MNQMTSDEILRISLSEPEKLFSGNLNVAKLEHRELLRYWHPDKNKDPKAQQAFAHMNNLYEQAIRLINNNQWKGGGTISFRTSDRTLTVTYSKVFSFELGDCYFGRHQIVYSIKKEYISFFRNAKSILSNLPYADDDMKKQMQMFLPTQSMYLMTDDRAIMIIPKTEDMIPLRELLNYYGGKIEPRHVAWVISSLYNIACYLNYSKFVHMNIDVDTCFVSPRHHAIYLFGGWWYSNNVGGKISTIPLRTMETLSPDVLSSKISTNVIDLDMIRYLGRELLGDRTGEHLKYDKDVPSPMLRWLRASTTEDSILDYKLWRNVLEECFGKPKFIEMDVELNHFYR